MNAKTFTITYRFIDPPTKDGLEWGVKDRSGTYALTYDNVTTATEALSKWTMKMLGREYIKTSYDVYTPLTITINDGDTYVQDTPSFGTVYPIVYDWGQVGRTNERVRKYVIDYDDNGIEQE